ncbi:hypothetical protein ACFLZH_01640 [Patescibacteria group bacterium]
MIKKCRQCAKDFEITNDDLKFYEKMGVVPPTLCPIDRARNRLAFRNQRNLYRRKCDATGKSLLSIYSSDVPFPVYDREYWYSDKWNGLDYGRDFDFNRPFFEQFRELYYEVPASHQSAIGIENCDYCNSLGYCRNCYLSFGMDYCESCYYITNGVRCKDCVDCLALIDSEVCYECVRIRNCYNLKYSLRCTNCSDSYFLMDCRGCKNCIGCVNLVNKDFFIFNKKVSKEEFSLSPKTIKPEFEEKKQELQSLNGINKFKKDFEEFHVKFPKKYYFGNTNEGFSGDDIRNLKNSYNCYYSDELENCKHCNYVYNSNNCQDFNIFGDNSSWIYNCFASGENCSQNAFCMHVWNGSSNNFYCNFLIGSNNCFGCCSLFHRKYCILNKQYSKEEFFKLRDKIIEHMKKTGEWGEFFPPQISALGYNETLGYEYYPLTKEEVLKLGWNWKDKIEEIQEIKGEKIEAINLPDKIDEVNEDILGQVIICSVSGRPFMIQKPELEFYKKFKIPLPQRHPEIRNADKLKLRNPFILHHKICDKEGCNNEFETTFTPEMPEKVYCEFCYLNEVV